MNFDVVIVGNGVVALTTALALACRRGVEIGVCGPMLRPGAASPAAGAMLGVFGEVTAALWNSDYGRRKLELNLKASDLWPAWLEQLNAQDERGPRLEINAGTFIVLNGRSGKLDDMNYRAIHAALEAHGRTAEEVNPSTIPGVDAVDECRPLRATFLPEEGFIHAGTYLKRLTELAQLHDQVTLLDASALKVVVTRGEAGGIELHDGRRIGARQVVVAAGVGSQSILDATPEVSRRVPRIFPGAGTSIVLRPTAGTPNLPFVVRTPNRSFSCGLHAVPRSAESVYVGATNHIRLTAQDYPSAYDTHFIVECALEQIQREYHRASLASVQIGHRPVSIDTFPLIGPTSVTGLWLATGTYRDGLQLSPLIGQHIANLLVGEDALIGEDFVPERNFIQTLSTEEAVAATLEHQMAIGYEHAMRVPAGWDRHLEDVIGRRVEEIFRSLDSDHVLAPDFMPMLLDPVTGPESLQFLRAYLRRHSA